MPRELWSKLPPVCKGMVLRFLNEIDGRLLVRAAPWLVPRQDFTDVVAKLGFAKLDLSAEWASHLTDMGLRSTIRLFPGAFWDSISLAGRSSITDAGISYVAETCTKLSGLDLCGCSKVTDEGVRRLAEACPLLASLILLGCSKVTDVGVELLAEGFPKLSLLDLGRCAKVTDRGVGKLAFWCPQLSSLSLWGCHSVTEEGITRLAGTRGILGP